MPTKMPKASAEVYVGLVGQVVTTFGPHTEAAPESIALQFMVALSNVVGRKPHFYIGEVRHSLNENVVVVGRSSRARKGDAKGAALRALTDADPDWGANIASGLSSGEGLIHAVRDATERTDKDGTVQTVDRGVDDKRLLVIETEFATALKNFDRQGNILSCVLRDAWDGKPTLRTLTKTSPTRATDAHISVIAHTTPEDLSEYLGDVEAANGLGNRFLYLLTDRVRLLPDPGRADRHEVEALVRATRDVLEYVATVGELRRTRSADALWARLYAALSADRPGLLGALLARAEAHVCRLAALYAIADRSSVIDAHHLESAVAVWDLAENSVKTIFADRSGNDAADRLLTQMIPGQMMALEQIREEIFAGHITAGRLSSALKLCIALGAITVTKDTNTGGRPRQLVTRIAEIAQKDEPKATTGEHSEVAGAA